MTFLEAALQILKEDSGGPLHYREIAARAIRAGYITSAGRTPEASIRGRLYTHIRKAEASGQEPKVRQLGRGMFSLLAKTKIGLARQISDSNEKVRRDLLHRLGDLHPRALENLVGALLSNIGFEEVSVSRYTGDGGIDVEAELTVGGVTRVKTAIQVKRWKNNVSGKTVRELRGGLMTDQRGLIMTTSSFTKEAIKEANAQGKTPVSLIDGERLLDLMIENQIGVTKKMLSHLELDLAQLEEYEEENGSSKGQALSLWPLPGGARRFVETTEKMLKIITLNEPVLFQMIIWVRDNFPKARSERTILGYVRVLKTLGLITFEGEHIRITEAGTEVITEDPREVLRSQLRERVAGVAEYLDALQVKSMTARESHDFFNEKLDVDWKTNAQTKFRLLWLENVGAIAKKDNAYMLA